MASIGENVRNIWKIDELRRRILYTVGLLLVYRLGAYVTLPGVDAGILADVNAQGNPNDIFGFLDMFVGGAFSQAGIFALGIMPYITASIIIQLLGAVVPYFQKLQREGEEGRRKITQAHTVWDRRYYRFSVHRICDQLAVWSDRSGDRHRFHVFYDFDGNRADRRYRLRYVAWGAHYGKRYREWHIHRHYGEHYRLFAQCSFQRVYAHG